MDTEFQAHSKEQQNVILLKTLLIAQPTQGLIIQCVSKLLFSSSPPLFPTAHFLSTLLLFRTSPRKCNGQRGEKESAQPFLLLDVGTPRWGRGLELFGNEKRVQNLCLCACPYHGGSKDLLTQRDERDSEGHSFHRCQSCHDWSTFREEDIIFRGSLRKCKYALVKCGQGKFG